jgi:hypothetical protein
MSKLKDLSGNVYGRLKVLSKTISKTKSTNARWLCLCECGKEKDIQGTSLTSGMTRSCGCLRREIGKGKNLSHGMATKGSQSPEYRTWCKIKERCANPKDKRFKDYGGRGIEVCRRWRSDFSLFLLDMGPRPAGRFSIERKDNNGHYSPENCEWIPMADQAGNKRSNVRIEFGGRTLYKAQWARLFGIDNQKFQKFERSGLSIGEIAVKCGWDDTEKAIREFTEGDAK